MWYIKVIFDGGYGDLVIREDCGDFGFIDLSGLSYGDFDGDLYFGFVFVEEFCEVD